MMVVETRILAREQRIHKVIRNFVEGNDDTVLAGETAIEFSILVIDGRTLRHVADRPKIEGERPRVEKERDDDPEKNDHHRHFACKAKKPRLETAARTDGMSSFLFDADFGHLLASAVMPFMEIL